MRSRLMIGSLAVLALLISLFVSSTEAQNTRRLMEYKVVGFKPFLFTVTNEITVDDENEARSHLEKALNKIAVEGWEFSGGVQGYLIFKRQK